MVWGILCLIIGAVIVFIGGNTMLWGILAFIIGAAVVFIGFAFKDDKNENVEKGGYSLIVVGALCILMGIICMVSEDKWEETTFIRQENEQTLNGLTARELCINGLAYMVITENGNLAVTQILVPNRNEMDPYPKTCTEKK